MNQVDILIEGYASVTETGWVASGTTTLVTTDSGWRILVDPGANRKLLLEKLTERKLTVDDIDYVFLTHLHVDHSLLMGIFPKAIIVNHEAVTDEDHGTLVNEGFFNAMLSGIKILKTPGHEYAGASLLVPIESEVIGIVGDVFWFEKGEKQELDIQRKDDFAQDFQTLVQSRKKVLELADWIIPGHGKMMKVEK